VNCRSESETREGSLLSINRDPAEKKIVQNMPDGLVVYIANFFFDEVFLLGKNIDINESVLDFYGTYALESMGFLSCFM
jgi:hypothetical protein